MIEVAIPEDIFLINRRSSTFISAILKRPLLQDASGGDRIPPSEEKVESVENTPLLPKRAEDNAYLCDLLLRHDLGEGLAEKVVETTYYNTGFDYSSLIPSLDMSYIAPVKTIQDNNIARQAPLTYSTSNQINYTSHISSTQETIYSRESVYKTTKTEDQFYSQQKEYNLTQANPTLDLINPVRDRIEYKPIYTRETQTTSLPEIEEPIMPQIEKRTEYQREEEYSNFDPLIILKETQYHQPQTQNYRLADNLIQAENIFKIDSTSITNEMPYHKQVTYENLWTTLTETPIERTIDNFKVISERRNESLDKLLVRQVIRTNDYVQPETTTESETYDKNTPTDSKLDSTIESELSDTITEPRIINFQRQKAQYQEHDKAKPELNLKAPYQEERDPRLIERLYKPQEETIKKNCDSTSSCFAAIIDWMDGKGEQQLTKKELKSLSACYAEDIHNIQEAREYLKERESGNYACGGSLKAKFHHTDFTEQQKTYYQLKDYIRNGEVQNGFKLSSTIIVGYNLEGEITIDAVKKTKHEKGEKTTVTLKKNTALAQMYIGLTEQGYTPLMVVQGFIDTDTGKEVVAPYIEAIAEQHLEAKNLLGDKDQYGMKLMGLISLINGSEPGRGTIPLHTHEVRPGDVIENVYKNDAARYEPLKQAA